MASPTLQGISFEQFSEAPVTLYGFSVEQYSPLTLDLFVKDIEGNGIENVTVYLDGVSQGLTDSEGKFFMFYEPTDLTTVLKLTADGYQDYNHIFNEHKSLDWQNTINRIVPILIANGKTFVNLNVKKSNSNILS